MSDKYTFTYESGKYSNSAGKTFTIALEGYKSVEDLISEFESFLRAIGYWIPADCSLKLTEETENHDLNDPIKKMSRDNLDEEDNLFWGK